MKGIDISHWQGNFDIAAAKKQYGLEFIILKIGGGDGRNNALYKDSRFDQYYQKAKSLGLKVGCYFFGNASSLNQAQREADYWLQLMKGYQFDFPVCYDVESKPMLNAGKDLLTEIVKTVCDKIEKSGYWVGIYSSSSFFNTKMNDKDLAKYTHWVAHWNTKTAPKLKSGNATQIWQTKVDKMFGIDVDYDEAFIDFSPIIKKKGLNGYKTAVKKSAEAIAKEVLAGLWGNGVRRKQAITEAGYNYNEIQSIVNKMVKEGKK